MYSALHLVLSAVMLVQGYGPPTKLSTITSSEITESSGLVASRTTPGAYWTHNDSGDGPFIYAVNTRGESLATYRVSGAEARDWEDIAAGPGPQPNRSCLYIGDIGDNGAKRSEIVVYRVPEPRLTAADKSSTRKRPRVTEPAEAFRLVYPDGKHDAEALMVHPVSGNLYIMTKTAFANPVVYEATAPLNPNRVTTLKRIGEVRVPSLLGGIITGGSISPDGRRVALCDYLQGYEIVLPAGSRDFNDIWREKLNGIDLGKRKQGESIAYRLDGNALLATSEGKSPDLIQVTRR